MRHCICYSYNYNIFFDILKYLSHYFTIKLKRITFFLIDAVRASFQHQLHSLVVLSLVIMEEEQEATHLTVHQADQVVVAAITVVVVAVTQVEKELTLPSCWLKENG
jgi:hypothetical protein